MILVSVTRLDENERLEEKIWNEGKTFGLVAEEAVDRETEEREEFTRPFLVTLSIYLAHLHLHLAIFGRND